MFEYLPDLLRGCVMKLLLTGASAAVGTVMSVVAGVARLSGTAPVRMAAAIYVEVFRGTSLFVQLFWMFFVLPHFGIVLDPFVVGVLALGLNNGAYGSEVVRGAILAV